ncbi:MAG: DNA-packaging protein [Clostridiales bacterium]|nr:DNA-packaging protein [Clostridiales bacterium]
MVNTEGQSSKLLLMKQLLNIPPEDLTKDTLLAHFLEQARITACGYCNVEILEPLYDGTICDLAVYLYQNRDSVGYLSKRQGERSVAFAETELPSNIMTALPLPKIHVMGGSG